MSSKGEDKCTEIPKMLYDRSADKTYKVMRFFGKGGFAKCYEIMDMAENEVYAGKIVSKKLLMKNNHKEKMAQEITIHRSLSHPNILANHHSKLEHLWPPIQKSRNVITEYQTKPSKPAADMVVSMLRLNPSDRPTVGQLLQFDFLNSVPVPKFLPTSCLTMSPRLETENTSAHDEDKQRKRLLEINAIRNDDTYESTFLKNNLQDTITASGSAYQYNGDSRQL
uniref:Protein kinase domain-containing protein n=1 Tax=Glossina austeni TaxID=7395 RepID=A0A1A9UZ53_GLOAU